MAVGSWPFCGGDPSKHKAVGRLDMGEEPLEPYVDENVAPGGTDIGYDAFGNPYRGHLITTRGQRRKLMAQNNADYYTSDARRHGGKKLYFFT